MLSKRYLIIVIILFSAAAFALEDNFVYRNMPVTLDFVERAELAINPLTEFADKNLDYAVWWQGLLGVNPVRMERTFWLYGKFTEALPLIRTMTSSELNRDVDKAWQMQLLNRYSADDAPLAQGPEGGRHLAAAAILSCLDSSGPWLQLSKKMVDKFCDSLIDNGSGDYVPIPENVKKLIEGTEGDFWTRSWWDTQQGWTLQGLSQHYRLTGYEPAREAARKLAYYLKDNPRVFGDDGRFLAAHKSSKGPAIHFHHNANVMEALSEYVLISGDKTVAEKALKCYKYARSVGEPLVGFFPEYITWPRDYKVYDCEGCCVADMVATSLNLSLSGTADLWDDLDRYVRNMFAEMQMLDDTWLKDYSATIASTPVGAEQYADNVTQKLIGDFAGWCPFNEFYGGEYPGVMHCCFGNCARAIYHIWLNTVHFENKTLKINLLLNHESRWATVESQIPYNGIVRIRPKQQCDIVVRMPEYVQFQDVKTILNGSSFKPDIKGRWLHVYNLLTGQTIEISFPMPLKTEKVKVGGNEYTLTIKGNAAIDCQPRGKRYPFFVHPEYKQEYPAYRTVKRSIPDKLPFWDGAVKIKKVME